MADTIISGTPLTDINSDLPGNQEGQGSCQGSGAVRCGYRIHAGAGLRVSQVKGIADHVSTEVVPQTVVTDIVDGLWSGHDKEWR